ncbi:MAG: sugar O-acetyltransferase [Bacteroidales bacterium]|nr:sugar O-acetyltransferase [Bacteroidales bacterium]
MKTEKEKMMNGEIYDGGDKELIDRWHLAKRLVMQYNSTDSTDRVRLDKILSQLLGSKGRNLWIAAPFFCDYGENIHIGENTEINCNCVFLDCNTIRIGSNVLIAPFVQIYTAFHPVKASDRIVPPTSTDDFSFCKTQALPVTIGDNVWIGGGSIILPGVTIGDNVTVGAGSVVTKSIPSDVLAFGNPCRIIRQL